MAGARLSDDKWDRIWACLKDHPGIYVGQEAPTRLFLDAVLWMARAGAAVARRIRLVEQRLERFARWQERASGRC